jgi:hypothetical protein
VAGRKWVGLDPGVAGTISSRLSRPRARQGTRDMNDSAKPPKASGGPCHVCSAPLSKASKVCVL